MMTKSKYKCETPVVLIIFNRPNETRINISAISKVQPNKLYVISDGPRNFYNSDLNNVNECRSIVENLNWDCEVIKIYSEANLGCMRRVVTGLNEVFESEDKVIILEDDCIPSVDFFKFCEWGLDTFESNNEIGLISGSNLLANLMTEELRNGFSKYINIWGWATWKSRWCLYDPFLTIMDIQINIRQFSNLNFFEKLFWKEVFKLSLYSSNIWDFRYQFVFFKNNLMSVYPAISLVENIGFGESATHTSIKVPKYVLKNLPRLDKSILDLKPNIDFNPKIAREYLYIRALWKYNFISIIKIKLMNIIRFSK